MKYKSGIYINLATYVMFEINAIPMVDFYLIEATNITTQLVPKSELDDIDPPNVIYLGEL